MPRSLSEYQRKRNFEKTPEPKGRPEPSGNHRFVVQKHWATRLHYDFRLEMEGVLVSWAIPKGPTLNPAERRLAAHVEDHPIDYFDFEGLIPKGEYGGGTVMVWDWGTYELEELTPVESLKRGEVKFRLQGEKLRGRFALVRTRSEKDWLLIKKRDEAADPAFDLEKLSWSVKTGRTREEIEAGKDAVWSSNRTPGMGGLIDLTAAHEAPMPKTVEPMKAQLASHAFDDERWLFEVKWDGVRILSFIDDGRVSLRSRTGRVVDQQYPELLAVGRLVKLKQAILDGELVALDEEGRPSFQLLQNRGQEEHPLRYVLFDLLYADGKQLYSVPLEDRKRLLQNVLTPSAMVTYSEHVLGEGRAFFKAAQEKSLEGIVAKRRDSPYQPGVRSGAWLKIKTVLQQEVVIGGFTQPRGSRKHFGAILVGVHDNGKLLYTGHTGGGFDERTLASLARKMKPLVIPNSPFAGKPPKTNEPATWVKPSLVAEVKFAEWTRDGLMRQPVFLGLRDDVDPTTVRRELPEKVDRDGTAGQESDGLSILSRATRQIAARSKHPVAGATSEELAELDGMKRDGFWEIGGRKVHLTNLDKVLFPEDNYTKRDLIRYYVQIAPVLIPYFEDRPLSMNPHPDGIHGKSFWQKDKPDYAPDWIPTFTYEDRKNIKDWIVIKEVATLAWLANHAVIDMHPWYSRIDKPEYPDWSVIDLDPAEGVEFPAVVELARVVKGALDHLKLKSLLKTTGQRGLHIYIPIERRYTLDESRGFVEKLASMIGQLMPELVTPEWEVKRRTGKIRIDYTQNVINKTLVGPYSVRPALHAPVSTPISWEELDDPRLRSDRWTIKNIGERLMEKGDLFQDALTLKQRLPKL